LFLVIEKVCPDDDWVAAIVRKDGDAVLTCALISLLFAVATAGLAVIAVYGRMTMQREWHRSQDH
jgi:hypothetical protein